MTRKAALTVRLPGARIAPAKSTWTCGHRRLENSGTKGLSRCSIVVGRVRIITSLWRTGDERTLPLLPYRMDKVELEGVFSEVQARQSGLAAANQRKAESLVMDSIDWSSSEHRWSRAHHWSGHLHRRCLAGR